MSVFVVSDGDHLVLSSSALVNGRHVQNAIGIEVESHLYLRHAARSGRDTCQLKLAQQVVVLRHCTLALIHLRYNTNLTGHLHGILE